ncbi:tetratricopeptide repeat protein [Haliea sp. E17]|uniref:tetratricopeptide repeat protein n=1 Tax=Haliea sp. E17 TaxID=3401576 RepID=UPI003AAB8F9C
MINIVRPVSIALLCLACAGCAGTASSGSAAHVDSIASFRRDEAFGPPPDIPSPDAIYQLTDAQTAAFDIWFNGSRQSRNPPYRRVADYLKHITEDFSYRGDTLLASEALAQESGNCLSLAILTTALARRAGVEIDHQLMIDAPVYQIREGVVEKGVHVRTRLSDPEWLPEQDIQLLRPPSVVIDYFPTGRERFFGNLSFGEFTGRYYRNLAVDALEAGELDRAYWYTVSALEAAPADAESLNLLAVVYRHAGMNELAEDTYRFGIANTEYPLTLLKNLRLLLLSEGRSAEAEQVAQQLSRIDDPSPMRWYALGLAALGEGDFRAAVGFLETAAELAPYSAEIQGELAKAYYFAGKRSKAKQAFARAVEAAEEPESRSLYQGKLAVLSRR